ncbi:hypothetical protein WBJ53_16185 [Spirosoma sp. SC4-14]|uniref:hypothetical protein n=1 Tax=Spirosoma sp. SC4-14 TaxID=3128900 RepID=UPI0030D3DAAD
MNVNTRWVALLDEDQDDFLILAQGINTWATGIDLVWFKNFLQFESALQTQETPPSLIILNGIAPSGTEFEWVKQFKTSSSFIEIPIIIMVEDYWEAQKQRYKTLNISDYVTKPVGQTELKTLVDKIRSFVPVI